MALGWNRTVLRYARSLTPFSVSATFDRGRSEKRSSVRDFVKAYTDANALFLLVDVPMSRVKFNVNSEYAYLQNFKVIQSTSRQ